MDDPWKEVARLQLRAYGCPCEFNALPTYDVCEGLDGMEIEEGYFGDVRLDGVKFASVFHWPGPVHEGHGVVQGIVDRAASEEQVEVLLKILSGEEQEPTTAINMYGSTIEPIRNPVTGAPHRARIQLPEGGEFRVGEMARAHSRALARSRSIMLGVTHF